MKLGASFSDSLEKLSRSKIIRRSKSVNKWWLGAGRVLVLVSLFFVMFFILIWRLFQLTVIDGYYYRRLSDGNRTRELVRHAPRGNLIDRTGKPMTQNILGYRLIKPCEQPSTDDCLLKLTVAEAEKIRSQGLAKGSFLEVDYQRHYLESASLAHLVGYLGELSASELESDYYRLRNYRPGDRVGRTGAEEALEERLRGKDGKDLVEIDAQGQIVRTLGTQMEVSGEDISLSLDRQLSQVAAAAFPTDSQGAIIVTKPTTGEILAFYSSPSYDLNRFISGLSEEEYKQLLDSPDRPLLNRVIGGTYPPGSTFKIVTALAALEEKAITVDTKVEDKGVITIGPFKFPNWYFIQYAKTEGMVDVIKAIKRSNDIFFYKAGEWLGISKLAAWAEKVGVGKGLGIDIGGEVSGLMPDPVWKKGYFTSPQDKNSRNDQWYLGDTYHVAIGQGYLLTTPLQVNAWTNVIASGGKLCQPTILKQTSDIRRRISDNCKDLEIKPETIDIITEGMKEACAPGGTGWPLFNFNVNQKTIPVACKTGTAEYGDPDGHTHAWFTAFAPLPAEALAKEGIPDDADLISGEPEISITVLVEGAGEGSNVAAPVAKKIFEEWFGR